MSFCETCSLNMNMSSLANRHTPAFLCMVTDPDPDPIRTSGLVLEPLTAWWMSLRAICVHASQVWLVDTTVIYISGYPAPHPAQGPLSRRFTLLLRSFRQPYRSHFDVLWHGAVKQNKTVSGMEKKHDTVKLLNVC